MISLHFEVDGDVQVARALSRFGEGVKDMRPAFKEIAKSFREIMAKQFASEGKYGSGGWAPLSPSYAEWKAVNFPGSPLLQAGGFLMGSLAGTNPWRIEKMDKDSLSLGTSIDYAMLHQRGTSRMPARQLIELTEDDKRGWMKILQRFMVEQIRRSGLR